VGSADPGVLVAVGDLHGDLTQALAVLRLAGVVDDDGHWAGGRATLVQTGDTTDRGPDSKALLDLMRRLADEAEAEGGRVVALLGNHEVMNLTGDWRYVHPGDLEAFGGAEARRRALALDGPYGGWLKGLPVAADLGDAIFVHGGIRPGLAVRGVDRLNQEARDSLMGATPTSTAAEILGPEGPLWFRDYVSAPESEACPALARALDALGRDRMVVGHTTRRDGRIQTRCGGRLHVIDIGISRAYGGNLGAWRWSEGDAVALYPTGPVDLEDPPS